MAENTPSSNNVFAVLMFMSPSRPLKGMLFIVDKLNNKIL